MDGTPSKIGRGAEASVKWGKTRLSPYILWSMGKEEDLTFEAPITSTGSLSPLKGIFVRAVVLQGSKITIETLVAPTQGPESQAL